MFTRFIFGALHDLIVLLNKPPFNVPSCTKACKYQIIYKYHTLISLSVFRLSLLISVV